MNATTAPLQPVPMDPADYDLLPPADLDVCDGCDGTGQIADDGDPRDPATGDVWTCGMCGGTGDLAGTYWIGAAS